MMDAPIRFRESEIAEVSYGKREITVIAVPYGQETLVDDGDGQLREKFLAGSFAGIESRAGKVTANRDHRRDRVFGLVKQFDSKAENGLISVVKASDTDLGNETLQLARDGVLWASVGFGALRQHAPVVNGLRSIYKAFLQHLAFTPEPAYIGAEVIDVREVAQIQEQSVPNLELAHAILRDLSR
jgi:phage head maturation protease